MALTSYLYDVSDANDHWRQELADAFNSVQQLQEAGFLTPAEAQQLEGIGKRYQIRLPHYYANLIDKQALQTCPIRVQAIPGLGEADPVWPDWAQAFSRQAFGRSVPWHVDPIGDVAKLVAPRVTHRYANRAIVHLSSVCAMYCRFCFRKSHLNDQEKSLYKGDLAVTWAYVAAHPEIREIILTGGDPLSLPDAWLAKCFAQLGRIPHIKHVRIHSRMAVTLPSRLTLSLAKICIDQPFKVSLVSHFNHAKELTPLSFKHLAMMREHGIALYNQSVLLKGVNDSVDALYELFQNLYEAQVTSFYLHHPDWTPGTWNFRVSIARGQALLQALRGKLSGPAMPDYVLDLPFGLGKVSLLQALVKPIQTDTQDGISYALYEFLPPHTRTTTPTLSKTTLYADFWPA